MFKSLLLTGTFLLKISYMTLTSLQQVFNPCPPTGWKVWNESPTKTTFLKLKIGRRKDRETGKILISLLIWSNLKFTGNIVDKLSNKKLLLEFNLSIDLDVVAVQIIWYLFLSSGNKANGPSFLNIHMRA